MKKISFILLITAIFAVSCSVEQEKGDNATEPVIQNGTERTTGPTIQIGSEMVTLKPSQVIEKISPNGFISQTILYDESQIKAIQEYWTEERLKNARPADGTRDGEIFQETIKVNNGNYGSPGKSQPRFGKTQNKSARIVGNSGTGGGGSGPSGSAYSTFPQRTVGLVYYTDGHHGGHYCTGAAIGNRAVLTSGHCLTDGQGNWHSNWNFRPGSKDGNAPYGIWYSYNKITFLSFHSQNDGCRDVGMGIVSDQNGSTLADTVGYLGFAWNYSRNQTWRKIAYLDEYGQTEFNLTGGSTVRTESCLSGSPDLHKVAVTNTLGSGSPWIKDFVQGSSGSNNYANSVQKGDIPGNYLIAPYFDTAVNDIRLEALNL